MPLHPGTPLGPYAVTAKIGEGGMGEVYRARDTKLDRDVALKVLPQAFTDDPDRFTRRAASSSRMTRIRHTGRAVALCVAFSVVSPSMALAQGQGTRQPVDHRHMVSANPFLLLAGWFNAEYERKLVETWTVAVSGSYVSFGNPDDVYVSGNAVFRYYPQGAALTGFYIGPRLGVFHVEEFNDSGASFGVGFELGYTWLLGAERHFSVSLGAGGTRLTSGTVIPAARVVNVGWAF